MTIVRLALVPLGLALAVAGCAVDTSRPDEATGDGDGKEVADEMVLEQADELAGDLAAVAWLERQRYLAVQIPPPPPGYQSLSETDRELLASSRSVDDEGKPTFELTVRIRVHFVPGNTSDWDPPGEATVARCFSYLVARDADVVPEVTECPDGEPLAIDTSVKVPEPPSIGPSTYASVRRFLRSGGTPTELASLEEELARGLTPTVEQIGRTTAVAVSARPDGTDCAVGVRRPDGRVVVWAPDRILTMPGEYGCRPSLAVDFPPGYVAGA